MPVAIEIPVDLAQRMIAEQLADLVLEDNKELRMATDDELKAGISQFVTTAVHKSFHLKVIGKHCMKPIIDAAGFITGFAYSGTKGAYEICKLIWGWIDQSRNTKITISPPQIKWNIKGWQEATSPTENWWIA